MQIEGINPDKQFLSIVCDSISMAAEYAKFDNAGFKLLKRNVLAHLRLFSRLCLRCRRHLREENCWRENTRQRHCYVVGSKSRNPLMSTTIAYDDDDYATNPELIAEAYGGAVDCIVDGGDGGLIPSTIVDCTADEIQIVRYGKGNLEE